MAYKIFIYIDDGLTILDCGEHKSTNDYANIIHDIAIAKGVTIYIDTHAFGLGLYDYLKEFKDLKVNKFVVGRSGI